MMRRTPILMGFALGGLNLTAACRAEPAPVAPAPETLRTEISMTQTPTGDVIEAALGFWRATPQGGEACLIALNRLETPGGRGVYVERCADAALSGATAWRGADGAVEVLDRSGAVLLRLNADGDRWRGRDASGRTWTLEQTPA